jgi:hypothetical protein
MEKETRTRSRLRRVSRNPEWREERARKFEYSRGFEEITRAETREYMTEDSNLDAVEPKFRPRGKEIRTLDPRIQDRGGNHGASSKPPPSKKTKRSGWLWANG